jgi:hypothetical protein
MDCYPDNDVKVKERRTKADIMTVGMAIKSNKSSKMHKLQVNTDKGRDSTRYKESKEATKHMDKQRRAKWGSTQPL